MFKVILPAIVMLASAALTIQPVQADCIDVCSANCDNIADPGAHSACWQDCIKYICMPGLYSEEQVVWRSKQDPDADLPMQSQLVASVMQSI